MAMTKTSQHFRS